MTVTVSKTAAASTDAHPELEPGTISRLTAAYIRDAGIIVSEEDDCLILDPAPLTRYRRARSARAGDWELTVGDGKGILIPNGPGILGSTQSHAYATGPPPSGGSRVPLTLGARGLAALYAGTPVASLRLAGLASGGSPDADSALDGAFAATPYMLDDF